MKKREFNKLCKALCGKDGLFDTEKVKQAENGLKNSLMGYIVKERHAIFTGLLNKETDMDWLACMGYMYWYKGKKFNFLCTCENIPKGATSLMNLVKTTA